MVTPTLPLFYAGILFLPSILATEFIFNGFNSSDLFMSDNSKIESSIITLTKDTSSGHALFRSKIPTRTSPNSSYLLPFSSSFIFSIAQYKHRDPGLGFAFVFVPSTGIDGLSSAQHLGFFNFTNGYPNKHVFGIKFTVYEPQEFNDINDNYVGVDLNSLTSSIAHKAGYWVGTDDAVFKDLALNNGVNYQVWIDYSGSQINVTMAPAGMKRPRRPLINANVDLSGVLLDEMLVGFCGYTGRRVQSHRILSWSFSNANFSIGEALVTTNLPSFVLPKKGLIVRSKGFIIWISTVAVAVVLVICCGVVMYVVLVSRKRRKVEEREEIEDWELEYWPHRIAYQEIYAATEGFSEENVIGFGRNGKIYRGVLVGGVEVAVKLISHERGWREFLAEVSSLGRLKHRNLVGLRGWCKREKERLILVYDYMENGSLDKRIFECEESMMLSWEERVKVLKDVACGVLYLHEGWEARVLHRDIKASNVLLDKDMNGRLGDFGLARMHRHEQLASTTRVIGTVGYMAPEVIRTGRASAETDVFGFGVLVLEVVCGRRPIETGKQGLVDWVRSLMERGELVCALDERLKAKGGYNEEEVEGLLHLGLLCVYPDARARPMMRQVVKVLERTGEGIESEGEGMVVNLQGKMKTTMMWSKHHWSLGAGGHPTLDEIRKSLSSAMSPSWPDVIAEG